MSLPANNLCRKIEHVILSNEPLISGYFVKKMANTKRLMLRLQSPLGVAAGVAV